MSVIEVRPSKAHMTSNLITRLILGVTTQGVTWIQLGSPLQDVSTRFLMRLKARKNLRGLPCKELLEEDKGVSWRRSRRGYLYRSSI